MNERRRQPLKSLRIVFSVLVAVVPLAGCNDDTPTAPERAATIGPAPTVTASPTATPTPLPGPLAAVQIALAPETSRLGLPHAFAIHIDVRETRGVAISASYRGVFSGANYNFPAWESGGGAVSIAPFASGSLEVFVEHDHDIPCETGIAVELEINASDGSTAHIEKHFDCTTGYWPLG
jgi:hypothetical protein